MLPKCWVELFSKAAQSSKGKGEETAVCLAGLGVSLEDDVAGVCGTTEPRLNPTFPVEQTEERVVCRDDHL